MSFFSIAELLVLLAVANGAPVIAKKVFEDRGSQPIDRGILWFDHRPLLGRSKTFRGLISSLVATTLAALLLKQEWTTGLQIAAVAMMGDLLSSFVKRRAGLNASARATGLDQIPESLFPAAAVASKLGLGWLEVLVTACIFFVGEIILSRILYRLHIRDRPY